MSLTGRAHVSRWGAGPGLALYLLTDKSHFDRVTSSWHRVSVREGLAAVRVRKRQNRSQKLAVVLYIQQTSGKEISAGVKLQGSYHLTFHEHCLVFKSRGTSCSVKFLPE